MLSMQMVVVNWSLQIIQNIPTILATILTRFWSPDGETVYICQPTLIPEYYEIYAINRDGQWNSYYQHEGAEWPLSEQQMWSPNGKKITLCIGIQKGESVTDRICVMNSDGSERAYLLMVHSKMIVLDGHLMGWRLHLYQAVMDNRRFMLWPDGSDQTRSHIQVQKKLVMAVHGLLNKIYQNRLLPIVGFYKVKNRPTRRAGGRFATFRFAASFRSKIFPRFVERSSWQPAR